MMRVKFFSPDYYARKSDANKGIPPYIDAPSILSEFSSVQILMAKFIYFRETICRPNPSVSPIGLANSLDFCIQSDSKIQWCEAPFYSSLPNPTSSNSENDEFDLDPTLFDEGNGPVSPF